MARRSPKIEVYDGNRLVPKEEQPAFLAGLNARLNARRTQHRLHARADRVKGPPERATVARAMLAVEERLVKALWTIARQPLGQAAPVLSARCGLEYYHEREDVYARYADAKAGNWQSEDRSRPALPSSYDISDADRVQDWLLMVPEGHRRVLVIGASYKRGDAGRNIAWIRLQDRHKDLQGLTVRRLRDMYREALRTIVSELTLARLG
jgi:hypothetical protein